MWRVVQGEGGATTLAERVLALISRGEVNATEAIVTYTNDAVEVLRSKVSSRNVFIGTIHAFARHILGELIRNHVVIGEAQRYRISVKL